MPTDPTARDVETARRIAGLCLDYPSNDDPMASCLTVDASRRLWCNPCLRADAIAAALTQAREEEREADAALVDAKARHSMLCECWECDHWHRLADAIRARGGAA